MKLTTQEFNRIIKESVSKVLNESANMEYSDVSAQILKETQKAYYIVVKYFTQKGLSEKEAKMWCPKSCCVLDNGNVTKVATFILDKWTQDYLDFLKSKGYKTSPISFNIADFKYMVDKKKAEKDEYQAYFNEVFNKLVEDIRPIIEKNIKEFSTYSKMLGLYLSHNNLVSSDKCEKLINFCDISIQKFGNTNNDWIERFFSKNPSREELYHITQEFSYILYGFSIQNRIDNYPKNLKYSATNIVDYEIKEFNGYYGKKEGNLYKIFKEYSNYYDKLTEMTFDALNSIK